MTVKKIRIRTQWSKEPDNEPDYSDWKITLSKKGNPFTQSSQILEKEITSSTAVTFSVHRNILGPQSEYFNRIFKSNNSDTSSSVSSFTEARHQHSHINFPSNISTKAYSLIVEAFEALLNYCYNESVNSIETSPVPLLFLCDYFQMQDDIESKIEDYSMKYFKKWQVVLDLLYEQVVEFRAVGLNTERAENMISAICYNRIDLLSKGTPMALIADLPLWLNVVYFIQEHGHRYDIPLKSTSINLSMNIANFLENNDNSSAVDFDSFEKLTGEKILPYVDANAALVLLKEEQKYVSSEIHISEDSKDGEQEEPLVITNLQDRCLESLVEAKLGLNINKELRHRATKVMTLLPRVMEMYLNKKTLHLYVKKQAKQNQLEQQLQEQKNETHTSIRKLHSQSVHIPISHDRQWRM